MQNPPPSPDDRPAERRTVVGRLLSWLAPEGPRDDWLEPDRDAGADDCPVSADCPAVATCTGPEFGGCPHR